MDNYLEGQNTSLTVDFIITWNELSKEFIVDFFDSSNSDSSSAYIETQSYSSFKQALFFAQEYA